MVIPFKFRFCAQVTLCALCRFITLCIQIASLQHNNSNSNNNNSNDFLLLYLKKIIQIYSEEWILLKPISEKEF